MQEGFSGDVMTAALKPRWPMTAAKRKMVFVVVATLLLLLSIFVFWPPLRYDFSKVHPRIQAMHQPYRSVTTQYYLDGGSIGIEIIDRDGEKLEMAVPICGSAGEGNSYHRLYLGARHSTHTNAIEVVFTEDTKRYLADVIARYPASGPGRDSALIALRGSPGDYVDVYGRALLGRASGK
jgi:hypothetical protein